MLRRAMLFSLYSAAGLILLMLACIGLFSLSIPMQEKLVCEFDDGDQMVVRQKYKFQLAGLVFRSAHRKRYKEGARAFYKPKGWFQREKEVDWHGRFRKNSCLSFSKINNTIDTSDAYKLPGEDWRKTPDFLFVDSKKREEMRLAVIGASGYSKINASTILHERSLVNEKCDPSHSQDRHLCAVQAVYQSRSHDNGRTWEPLVLTKESRLYELGKPVYEQKGVARPVDWTGKPWFSGKPKPEASTCPKKKQAGTDCAGG